MKKFILLIIISIVLFFTLGVGVKNTKSAFKSYEESFYKIRTNCIDKNGIYENDAMKKLCDNFVSKDKYAENIGAYFVNYEDSVQSMARINDYDIGLKYLLFILIGLDSIWFVHDFLKSKKINKKNNDELRKKAIFVSLIPVIPFTVYSILKVLSPFVVIKDYLLIEKSDIKTIICYLLAGILISVITSLIGLVLSKRNYNTIKNLIGIIIMIALVELSIVVATKLINSVFVFYYEGLELFHYESACILQVLLLVFTIIVGLLLYKIVPSLKESK